LYEYKTWSFALREEHRLRVFLIRVRRIFRSKREAVTGGYRKLHYEVLHNLYASPNNVKMIRSRRMRLVGHVTCMRDMRKGKCKVVPVL
jgi:hypothetical protein